MSLVIGLLVVDEMLDLELEMLLNVKAELIVSGQVALRLRLMLLAL